MPFSFHVLGESKTDAGNQARETLGEIDGVPPLVADHINACLALLPDDSKQYNYSVSVGGHFEAGSVQLGISVDAVLMPDE